MSNNPSHTQDTTTGNTVQQQDESRGTKRTMTEMRTEGHESTERPTRDTSRPIGKKVVRRSNGWDDDKQV
jgi:hypothetical protein